MRRISLVLGVILGVGLVGCGGVDHTALGDLENCLNGVDDNGDGLADCDDPQCLGHAACIEKREMNCANGADDDGDTLVDCADPDCAETLECGAIREWSCHDDVDNDGDGFTDCDDDDCIEACTEVCNDGADNDNDNLVDCADPDCAGRDGCPGNSELCGNGQDDDGDSLVDCADPDCAQHPLCILVELCNTEADDDNDGHINCEDPDCAGSPYCKEIDCLDGHDNDNDSYVDCDDSDCTNAPECQSGSECLPALPLPCGQWVESTTEGRLNNFTSYQCPTDSVDGPERYFQFTAGRDLFLDIYLTDWNLSGLAMIAVGGDPNSGCNLPGACHAEDYPGDNFLLLEIAAGDTLFLVVDGPASTPGPFDLIMDCVPIDEVGLCDDGLNNDPYSDFLADCWDDDCLGDPVCDYWVSAGISCTGDLDCAPGEYCSDVTFESSAGEVSFCTRDCTSSGAVGGECATVAFGNGLCSAVQSTDGLRCVLPCSDPTDSCPSGTTCTNIWSGSISNLTNSYCLPNQ
jgi:hypothetical protein